MANYLLVDGYNIIYAWEELKKLADVNIDSARMELQEILCNYQGYHKENVILVFDGYKVKGNLGSVLKFHNIHVVYTKEAETADQYIEKVTGAYLKEGQVRVATSDRLEQMIILGQGAQRVSARDFHKEIREMNGHIRKHYIEKPTSRRNSFIDNLPPEMAEMLEKMRLTETDD